MKRCKFCKGEQLLKAGSIRGKRRYKCISCNKTQINGDNRIKYTEKEKRIALKLYLEGNGFRRIERILTDFFDKRFRNQTIMFWIKSFGREGDQREKNIKRVIGDIDILEMDELHTFVKKRGIK
jgi:transposase-like protein